MTDELALIRVVCQHGYEPLPRLIYADWLDDIGDPPSVQKSTFLRTWCKLCDVPLTDLDGYAELAEQLGQLRVGLSEDWFQQMSGSRFHITNPDMACARAEAFLRQFLAEGDYSLSGARERGDGWLVSLSILPVVEAAQAAREKEHKRGGMRSKRVPTIPARRRQLAFPSATPLFVEWTTARVDWHRGSGRPPMRT